MESDETRPLQRDQFETLYQRITHAFNRFDLDRLPPDADPYPAVLSLHPRFKVDEDAGTITETEVATPSQLLDDADADADADWAEPDVAVYGDTLLLIDALERHDPTALNELETNALVNIYTLLSDVQRDANDLRQDVADVLLTRLHHDRPVHGQYGSSSGPRAGTAASKTTTRCWPRSNRRGSIPTASWASIWTRSITNNCG